MNPRILAAAVVVGALAVACTKVPYSHRTQYNLVPDSMMRSLGKSEYSKTLKGEEVVRRGEDAQVLDSVGAKISRVANQPDYDWQFNLIQSDQINAWCLPGGYIAFYTGILPVLRNEAGMAFVMGHETGHAVAHHGAERMTQQLTLLGGLAGLGLLLDAKTELTPAEETAILGALGIGAEVGIILPFSRTMESEADTIGVMYMANAGYPPEEAVTLWDRMERQTGGSSLPAFLSDHPPDEKRKERIREWLPRADKRYERNKLNYDTTEKKW